MRIKMKHELDEVNAFLDNITPDVPNSNVIFPEVKVNGVVEEIANYLLTNPNGIGLVQSVYSGMPLDAAFEHLKIKILEIQVAIQTDEAIRMKLGKGMEPVVEVEMPVLSSTEEVKDDRILITASNVEYIETASIKQSDYDWYTFSGLRKKKFKYANKEYVVAPGGIVGIGKNPDLQGKHSCCIVEDSGDHAIQLKSKDVNLFKKRCVPFEGDVEAIFNPNPTSYRVSVG